MDWSKVEVDTRIYHEKSGAGKVVRINHQRKTCQIVFDVAWLEEMSFSDIEKDGRFKFLVWVQATVNK